MFQFMQPSKLQLAFIKVHQLTPSIAKHSRPQLNSTRGALLTPLLKFTIRGGGEYDILLEIYLFMLDILFYCCEPGPREAPDTIIPLYTDVLFKWRNTLRWTLYPVKK